MRPRFRRLAARAAVLLAAGVAFAGAARATGAPAAPLSAQERRGKALYLRGAAEADAEVTAHLRGADLDVPGGVMPCANCHGRDGRGRPEGGVRPPDITWEQLARRGAHVHAEGRTHAPHTPATLASAITRGLDPDGQVLDAAMPAYRMPPADLEALVAYLQRLGRDRDPGVDAERVSIGTLAPLGNPAAREAQATWRAFFDDVNARGGVHGRRLELRAVDAQPGPRGSSEAARRLLGDAGVFALVGVAAPEPADELLTLVEEREVPLIGPFTLFPRRASPPDRHVFHLVAGVAEQARALVGHARARLGVDRARVALAWPDEPGYDAAAAEIAAACETASWPVVVRHGRRRDAFDGAELVAAARAAQADVLMLLGARGEERAVAAAAETRGWHPWLLLPAYVGGASVLELPARFERRALVGLALPPFEAARVTDEQARRLFVAPPPLVAAARHPGASALAAFRAARVLLEGLRRAGRDLSRDGLIDALEGLYDFDAGLGPPVTFGPNRRSGSPGAHIVTVDLARRAFVPVSEWTAGE